jgi:MYXO-CTERM domain-containing protein
VLYPADWVGRYPKWDQLSDPTAFSHGGSMVEWHHDANGAVESGSAPLYLGANDKNLTMCLVDQATSTCRQEIALAPLQRGHWHDYVLHAKWSSNAKVGFLEIWIDGVNVLPKEMVANKYPGMRNYLVVGLYRNGRIGDPSLRYPNGTRVYSDNDGTPGVAYLDGFIAGKTQQSVLNELPWGPPAPAPQPDAGTPPDPPPAADAGTPQPAPTPAPDPVPVADADAGTPDVSPTPPPATQPVTVSGLGYPGGGGCSTTGAQPLWLALPLLGLLLRRRRGRSGSPSA